MDAALAAVVKEARRAHLAAKSARRARERTPSQIIAASLYGKQWRSANAARVKELSRKHYQANKLDPLRREALADRNNTYLKNRRAMDPVFRDRILKRQRAHYRTKEKCEDQARAELGLRGSGHKYTDAQRSALKTRTAEIYAEHCLAHDLLKLRQTLEEIQ